MDMKEAIYTVLHFLLSLVKTPAKAETEPVMTETESKNQKKLEDAGANLIAETEAAVSKEAEAVQAKIVKLDLVGVPLTREQRIRKILDLILDQVLAQKYKAPEYTELNLIHPDYAAFVNTVGAGMASEFTEQRIQALAKNKDYRYAELYAYQALSAQWLKASRYLIQEAGKLVAAREGSKLRAKLHELWRQTVWTDGGYADDFLNKNRLSDAELEEFLFALADDEVEASIKTDQRVNA